VSTVPSYFNSGSFSIADAAKTIVLNGGTLHLFKAGFEPGPTTTLADLTAQECDYLGYLAKSNLFFFPPTYDAAGGMTTGSDQVQFKTGDLITLEQGNVVGGWWLGQPGEDPAPEVPIAWNLFPSPIPMQYPHQGFQLLLGFNFGRNV
jgi:hypothetical protein